MKKLSISTWLQIIYCICCGIVVICMHLCTFCYPTTFSNICFKAGALLNFLCALNPVGIICGILNLIKYLFSDKKANKKLLIWVIVGPILTTLAWYCSICAFVGHSGGV